MGDLNGLMRALRDEIALAGEDGKLPADNWWLERMTGNMTTAIHFDTARVHHLTQN